MTREFKSWRSFWDFNHAVRRKLRYVRAPEHEEFLKTVAETSHSRKVVMKEGFVLWRAQLGHEYREEKQGDEVFEIEAAYSPARMKPLPDKAYDGRANPKGIPCLYPQPARKRHCLLPTRTRAREKPANPPVLRGWRFRFRLQPYEGSGRFPFGQRQVGDPVSPIRRRRPSD